MGNFVHEVFENMYALDPKKRQIIVAKELARDLWDRVYRDLVLEVLPESRHNDFRWKSWFCIENLWAIENPELTTVDEIEYELNGDLGGVTLKGFVDRFHFDADGRIVVGDYKTGKVPSPKWEDDKFFQLYIYAALLERLGVGDVSEVQLLYVKGPKVLSRQVTEKDLTTATETVVSVKQEIDNRCESGNFETKTGPLCNWCYFKRECPAWR